MFTFQGSDLSDARAVLDLARSGRVVVDVVPYPLDRAAEAYEALETGGLAGRVVVVP